MRPQGGGGAQGGGIDTAPAVPSDPPAALSRNRATGELRASFGRVGARTAALRFYESGGLRLRFPKPQPGLVPECEAVMINTGGGFAGGDSGRLHFEVGSEAGVTITTQSAEKVYRAEGALTCIEARLELAAGATLEWLPQETILFDQARLLRRLEVDMAPDANLLLAESVTFGRLAHEETLRSGLFGDQWRVRRGGRLVFAEAVALRGPLASLLERPALGAGGHGIATLILVSSEAESKLASARAALGTDPPAGAASAWNGMLVVRLLAPSPALVRAAMMRVLEALRGRPAPRVWQ